MARKSDIAKDYYPKPIEKPQKRLIMYHMPNRWSSQDRVWDVHGFKFKEGVVYSVSELVYEWSKRQKGFFEVRDIETDKVVDFK